MLGCTLRTGPRQTRTQNPTGTPRPYTRPQITFLVQHYCHTGHRRPRPATLASPRSQAFDTIIGIQRPFHSLYGRLLLTHYSSVTDPGSNHTKTLSNATITPDDAINTNNKYRKVFNTMIYFTRMSYTCYRPTGYPGGAHSLGNILVYHPPHRCPTKY